MRLSHSASAFFFCRRTYQAALSTLPTPEKNAPRAAIWSADRSRSSVPLLSSERSEHADAGRGDGERAGRRVAGDGERDAGRDAGDGNDAEQDQQRRVELHGSRTRMKTVPCPFTSRCRRQTSPPFDWLPDIDVLPSMALKVCPPTHSSKSPTWSNSHSLAEAEPPKL